MYFIKTPQTLKNIFPAIVWDMPMYGKTIYLTLDDGPTPNVTDWTLDLLKQYGIKATFFCIGENVVNHPELFSRIRAEGHAVGNHSFTHKNGWKTDNFSYYKDILKCSEVVDSDLYRPPYGRITKRQIKTLNQKKFTIVMWDVLSGDFDVRLSEEQCLQNVLSHTKPGSIVVFHDSLKAEKRLKYSLPKFIEHFLRQGYNFKLF